jgi:hypothetical protein
MKPKAWFKGPPFDSIDQIDINSSVAILMGSMSTLREQETDNTG